MIWIGLLLSLASCKDSLEAITLGGDELPTEGVTLSIQLPNFTPQEISTRAGGETTESITSLWLVCYDTSDNCLDMKNCTEAYAAATADTDGYKKIKINLPKGTETVHLVANFPDLTEAQAANLDAMVDINPDLSKPICWGKAILSDLMKDSKISLTRQCAKITCTVDAAVSNFEITDLHVWHSATKGSIAPAGYKESTNKNLATSTDLMDDTKHIEGGSAAVVAVNETSAGKADIIIKAKYNGTEGFYKVALYKKDTNKTEQYALVRNHNYKVKVISVNDPGYATEAEALKAQPENRLQVTVVDDNPEIVDMIACKDYELGVCGTQTVAATSTTAPITLVTNLKAENTTDNNLYKVEISGDAKSWITSWSQGSQSTTTPRSPDESAPKGTKFVLNLTLVANNKSENAREGTITITSGDLKRTIKNRQEGYDFKRADDRKALIRLKDGETPFAYFDWLDNTMNGVKTSENHGKSRNQGLHFSVGDNTISYLIPKKGGDEVVKYSNKISYSDEVYKGHNYYKVTLNNGTSNYDLWTVEEGFVIKNTADAADAAHPIIIKYPIYHTGVFGEIKDLEGEQLGVTKITGWYYYEVVKVNVKEPSEDGNSTTDKTYYMLDRNLGASNSDFYSPGSANIANDKNSIGGYFKISNNKSSNTYIDKYVIGNFRVPKGNELEAIAGITKVVPLKTSTGEPYNCIRIETESSSLKKYIYIPISGYYESNSFKDEYHANLWSKSLLSGYQGFSESSKEYGFWYLYLDIYNKEKTITNTRFVQGYDGSNTGRYKAMPVRLIYVP